MKQKIKEFKNSLIVFVKNIFLEYKYFFIAIFLILLIGMITGIVTASRMSSDLSCEYLINKYLYDFLKNDMNYLTFFLILLTYFLLIVIIAFLFIRNKILFVCLNCLCFLLTYIFGFDLCIVVITLGLTGVIFGVFVYGIFGLIIIINLSLILAIISKYRLNKSNCIYLPNKDIIKLIFLILFLNILVMFLMTIIFSIIHIFVIVK